MKWSASIALLNEEHNVQGMMESIMDQSIRPSRVLAFDDGSTDRTGEMLDDMEGVTVSHGPPHLPQHSHPDFIKRRFDLLMAALPGMDYSVSMDADVRFERNYIERVTDRMKSDGAVIASGTNPECPAAQHTEQAMVVDAKWARERRPHQCALNFLCAEAADDGRLCALYKDISFSTTRPFREDYEGDVERLRGANQRQRGMAWYWALYHLVRSRRWSWWMGYVSYRGHKLPKYHAEWCNSFILAQKKKRLGIRQDVLIERDSAIYIALGRRHGS